MVGETTEGEPMPEYSDIQAEVDAVVAALTEAADDGSISAGEGWDVIRGPVWKLSAAIRKASPDDTVRMDLWTMAAKQVYSQAWVPYDIPGVGPVFEMVIDNAGERAIEPLVKAVYTGADRIRDMAVEWAKDKLGDFLTAAWSK